MVTLRLPSMVAGRHLANSLVDAIAADLHGAVVVIDCRALVSASPSFSSQLLTRLLIDGAASKVVLRHSPEQFTRYVLDSAATLAVVPKVEIARSSAIPA